MKKLMIIIKSMRKVGFSILALNADVEAAGLCIRKIGAGTDFKILLLTRRPGFNITGFYLQIGMIGADGVFMEIRSFSSPAAFSASIK